jgi:hypothetical protein
MPFVHPIQTLPSTMQASLKPKNTRAMSQSSKNPADSIQFGNPTSPKTAMPSRLNIAFQSAFKPSELKKDAMWGVGFSLLAAIIPPHAHALLMFPATFAINITMRAVQALMNPESVYKELQNAAKQVASK